MGRMRIGYLAMLLAVLPMAAQAYEYPWHREEHRQFRQDAGWQGGTADQSAQPLTAQVQVDSPATVAFSPNGDGTKVIVRAIDLARRQILVQAYGFTSAPIIQALGQARARGVDVAVLLDKSNETGRYSGATYLINHQIPVWIDSSVRIAHNKVMVIDGMTVVTGSFNFTKAAQRDNAENVLILWNAPALAAAYLRDWQWRKSLSHGFQR